MYSILVNPYKKKSVVSWVSDKEAKALRDFPTIMKQSVTELGLDPAALEIRVKPLIPHIIPQLH